MAGEFILTVGDSSQLDGLFNGKFMKGRAEQRIAMVGRSNVGKSSLINALLSFSLARTSNQPGKTRQIHFYLWKEAKRIVADLPGFGYAKVSAEERNRWAAFVESYLEADSGLECTLVLLDGRHGPTEIDLDAIRFLSSKRIPMIFVLTKVDTLKTQKERASRKKEVDTALREIGVDPSHAFWVSAKTKDLGLKKLSQTLQKGDLSA